MPKPNLHPCYCPWCRKDLGTVEDLGRSDRVYGCSGCHNHYTGAVWPGRCPMCGDPPSRQQYIKTLDPNEPVPGGMCSDCMDKQATMDQAVKDGGVRFQCLGCGKDGVFAASTNFAKKVREESNKPTPQDVFVQIQGCPQCPKPEQPPEGETVNLLDDDTECAKQGDAAVDAAVEIDLASVGMVRMDPEDADLDGLVDDIMSLTSTP